MKKYMIRCDIEGVSGVVSYEQAEPGRPEYAYGQRMFMNDLLALIDGLNEGGADEIVVYDEHYYGRNVDVDELQENVTVICGKPPYRADWAGGLDSTFAGVILLGFHSKRGTGELLHHTYEPDIADLLLNGISVGEIGMEAAIAGDWNVPLVMITADSAGVKEAETLVPGVVGVSVKESLWHSGGACYATMKTAEMITEAAKKLVGDPPPAKPWKISSPVLKVVFARGAFHDTFKRLYGCGDYFTVTGSTVTECWARYWQMKLAAQEAMK